jgi:hypothetical protein
MDRPLIAGLIALAGSVCFVLARLWLAAGWNITKFVQAAAPYAHRGEASRGLYVFRSTGYDGQFYYRLALDPANLHHTAFGITMDAPYRLQRIGYPALAWLASLGQHAWVPVALVAVNVLALGAIGLAGGMLARDRGRHALWGLLLAGYFGFFISVGCDLTEPVAAACLLAGVLACRRGRPVLAGLAFGYGALTRETVLIVPLALGVTRLIAMARRQAWPGAADLAWCLPAGVFAAWQAVLWAATGRFILLASVRSNSAGGVPFGQFAAAVRMNLGLLVPPTGAAYIWFLEVATLLAFVVCALACLRSAAMLAYERVAFVAFLIGLGALSATIWVGHADLRSVDEVYLFAVLILFGSGYRRGLGALALCAGLAAGVAATHQALYLAAGSPGDQVSGAAGVDHPGRLDAVPFRLYAAAVQPVELPGGVRVGVDGEQAAGLGGQGQQPVRRVLAFRPAVDLDRHTVLPAGGEHPLRVERRLRPGGAAAHHPAGAVPQHVHVRAGHRGDHAFGHRPGRHPQLGMHAGHHDVEPAEQVVGLVE